MRINLMDNAGNSWFDLYLNVKEMKRKLGHLIEQINKSGTMNILLISLSLTPIDTIPIKPNKQNMEWRLFSCNHI